MKKLSYPLVLITFLLILLSDVLGGTVVLIRNGKPLSPSPSSIQAAVEICLPGDYIELNGTFTENILIKRSGIANKYITMKPAKGKTATLIGSVTSTVWVAEGNLYRTTVPYSSFSGITNRSTANLVYRNNNSTVLVPYATKDALNTLPINYDNTNYSVKGGSFRGEYNALNNTTNIYVRFENNANPNSIPLSICTAEAVITLANQSFWKIEGLTIKNGGWAGVYMNGNTFRNVLLKGLTIQNCFRGISSDKNQNSIPLPNSIRPFNIEIQNCRIENSYGNWTRAYAYNPTIGGGKDEESAPGRNKGIFLCANNSKIINNYIYGNFDAIQYQGANAIISHNTLELITDDAIELESSFSKDITFDGNYILNAFVGISLVSQQPGPIYIYRNIIQCTRQDKINGYGSAIKMGADWKGVAKNVKIYHNTIYGGKLSVWEKIDDDAEDNWNQFEFINNIFYTFHSKNYNFRGANAITTGGDNTWLCNFYNKNCPTDEPGKLCDLNPEATFVDEKSISNKNLKLKEGSPAIDAASFYVRSNKYPDYLRKPIGNSFDIGAWEFGDNTISIGSSLRSRSEKNIPND